jgi:hypothetical protein
MGDDMEVHVLRRRGWTISAIARHTARRPGVIDHFNTTGHSHSLSYSPWFGQSRTDTLIRQ